jgi:hypothetical protein
MKKTPLSERRETARRLGIRTTNAAEKLVAGLLVDLGFEVLKNGWPDFVAVRGHEVLFLEVKPHPAAGLSPRQRRMAAILERVGIRVLTVSPLTAMDAIAAPRRTP